MLIIFITLPCKRSAIIELKPKFCKYWKLRNTASYLEGYEYEIEGAVGGLLDGTEVS